MSDESATDLANKVLKYVQTVWECNECGTPKSMVITDIAYLIQNDIDVKLNSYNCEEVKI